MGGPGTVDGQEREEFANFLPCRIEKDGIVYPSAEHFFQAHKTLDRAERQDIAGTSFESVHGRGQRVTLRPDWEAVKLSVMLQAAELKYEQHPNLRAALLHTRGRMTFTPSAGFWGVDDNGAGENWNGRIHDAVRAKLGGNSALYDSICGEIAARSKELGSTT
uniref:NADAR domain-containing protein n=1 Tax=Noctiluca scintillans TaxID=2966 RepID=A0A7S0ZPS5_NOCSC|mmetsp:Transcript_1360/g.3655  ORF Transcript_1360/g.3655 Transcript_1360/m.3655 type:complete len:163 (+) Transcript_1360:77-565(+)